MTVTRSEQAIEVVETADASPAALFAVLRDPRRHVELDGSGMLQADPTTDTDASGITGVGDVFTMAMHYESLGDYRTHNHVLEFEPDHRIAWTTGREDNPPAGVVWSWTFDAVDGHTRVTHRYDWSGVTDPAVLARVTFPRVQPEQLTESVRNLISLAS